MGVPNSRIRSRSRRIIENLTGIAGLNLASLGRSSIHDDIYYGQHICYGGQNLTRCKMKVTESKLTIFPLKISSYVSLFYVKKIFKFKINSVLLSTRICADFKLFNRFCYMMNIGFCLHNSLCVFQDLQSPTKWCLNLCANTNQYV